LDPTQLQEPEWVFPFQWMKVGDSFFVPTLRPSQMIVAVNNGARRAGIRARCFVTLKDGHLGVRVWRIT
jgi:hypothetical protein